MFPSLYSKYKDYYWHEVEKIQNVEIDNDDLLTFLNNVWEIFGKYSADELEYMTHQEEPWKKARVGLSPVEPSFFHLQSKLLLLAF